MNVAIETNGSRHRFSSPEALVLWINQTRPQGVIRTFTLASCAEVTAHPSPVVTSADEVRPTLDGGTAA